MKSVLIAAKQYQSLAGSAERGVLKQILDDPENAAQCTIRRMAELSYTSPSTVVRLCRKLGFSGFRELQKALVAELVVRRQSRQNQEKRLDHDSLLSEIINKVTFRNISCLEESMRLVEQNMVCRCVDLICRSSTVLLFGMGASYLVAQDAYLKFIRADKRCSCCEDIHVQYVLARNATPQDVAIVISYSGCTEEVNRCARYLKQQGTPIIAITRFVSSPLAQMADCCLYVMATEELFRSGAMSSRISQLNMIDILYTAYLSRDFPQNYSRIQHNQLSNEKEEEPEGGGT